MTPIVEHIRALEAYVRRDGARLVRSSLPERVHGRVLHDVITLRAGLRPEQELPTLVHELAHWLVHRDAHQGPHCTLFEYEAEAVEALVMARLGLAPPALDPFGLGHECPTDGLLSASVERVVRASGRICGALGLAAEG